MQWILNYSLNSFFFGISALPLSRLKGVLFQTSINFNMYDFLHILYESNYDGVLSKYSN